MIFQIKNSRVKAIVGSVYALLVAGIMIAGVMLFGTIYSATSLEDLVKPAPVQIVVILITLSVLSIVLSFIVDYRIALVNFIISGFMLMLNLRLFIPLVLQLDVVWLVVWQLVHVAYFIMFVQLPGSKNENKSAEL